MNTFLVCNCVTKCVAFICVTEAAIHFQRPSILWFFLIPALLGGTYESKKEDR